MNKRYSYPCLHEPCYPVNCDLVINEFHRLLSEAGELVEESDKLEEEALSYVIQARDNLRESLELVRKGICIEERANRILDKSGCSFNCNKDSYRCKSLEERAAEFYKLCAIEILGSIRLLKEVIHKLKKAAYYDQQGNNIEAKYIKCIHDTLY